VLEGLMLDCLFLIDEMCRMSQPPSVHDVMYEMDVSKSKAQLAVSALVDELYVWIDDDERFHMSVELREMRPEPMFVRLFEDDQLTEEFWR
jgi:hypothetical protein